MPSFAKNLSFDEKFFNKSLVLSDEN